MAYLCLDCYEIYEMDLPYCPKSTCNGGTIIEVDELMLPTIMLLNQKGYCTEFCCSGHSYKGYCNPYILFNTYSSEEIKGLFEKIPEPWYYEYDNFNRISLRCRIFNSPTEQKDMVTIQKEICDVNLKLLDFVNALPSLYYDECDD